ncbi:MAG: nucleoside triphosphate pyrophosphohydrolase [Candidatus Melainabacteria bacterium]|nr:nucleoside triphosphate pyrophosphohydrolase [Candidatus Melainabacteria bacterium]
MLGSGLKPGSNASTLSMVKNLDNFISTIAHLRSDNGCPWDKDQTHESLARYLLEEAYEVLEAIHLGDPVKLQEELGDLLLQIVLNAQIAKEAGHFDIEDVAESINQKMINRHPHVFGQVRIDTAAEVVAQWEELKHQEKAVNNLGGSAIDGVPKTLPALLKALKISEKAVQQGFEWNNKDEVWEKLYSELEEFKHEASLPEQDILRRNVDLELGDVFFTLVNLARWEHLNPEESLLLAIEKFKKRFSQMEELSDKPLKKLSKAEWAELWQRAKFDLQSEGDRASKSDMCGRSEQA